MYSGKCRLKKGKTVPIVIVKWKVMSQTKKFKWTYTQCELKAT